MMCTPGQTGVSVTKLRGRAEPCKGGGGSSLVPSAGSPATSPPRAAHKHSLSRMASGGQEPWGGGLGGSGPGSLVRLKLGYGPGLRSSDSSTGAGGSVSKMVHSEATGWRLQLFAAWTSPRGCSSVPSTWWPASSTAWAPPVREQGGSCDAFYGLGSDVTLSLSTHATGQTQIAQPSTRSREGTDLHLLREGVSKSSGTDLKATWLHGTPGSLPLPPFLSFLSKLRPASAPAWLTDDTVIAASEALTAGRRTPTARHGPGGFHDSVSTESGT